LLTEGGYKPLSQIEYWNAKRAYVSEDDIIQKTCPDSFVEPYVKKRLAIIEDFKYLVLDKIWEGIPTLLKKLSQAHTLYMVTTRNRRDMLMKELEYFNLVSYFNAVFSKDNNEGNWRVKYQLIKNTICRPTDAVIIGDTEDDINTGKALGITTCAVTCGIRDEEHVAEMGADFILPNSLEVLTILPLV
jgi:phosphoglycolate phosphatase